MTAWARGRRLLRGFAGALLLLGLIACGSPAERAQRHLERGIELAEAGRDGKAMIEFRNVLRIEPKNATALYRIGLLHEKAERWPQAFAAFEAATNERPGYREAHVKLGTLALLGGDLDRARKEADTLAGLDPDDPDGAALQAALALRSGDKALALERARAAIARDPDHDNALAVLVGTLAQQGERARALAALDTAIARRPRHPPLRLLAIQLLEAGGDPAAVRAAYEALVALEPTNEGYLSALAAYLQRSGDRDGAEAALRRALDAHPGSVQVATDLVRLVQDARGFEAAAAELAARIEKAPGEPGLRFLMAELQLSQRRLDQADAALQAIVEAGKEDGTVEDARAGMAQVALARQDTARAKALAQQVLATKAEHRGANFTLAVVALQENRLDDVVSRARTALRRDPAWLPALRIVAEAHARRGETELAMEALNAVLAAEPGDAAAAQALAGLMTERGDLDSARKIWDRVLVTAPAGGPGAARALEARAQIAIRQESWAAAAADIEALRAIPEQEVTGALLTGNLLLAQDRFEQGREWFVKAQGLAPEAPEPVIGVVRSHLAQGDLPGATAFLAERTRASPDDAIAFNLLGELAARGGDSDGADRALAQAVALAPGWAAPRRQQATLALARGRTEEAVTALEAATAAIPDDTTLLDDLAIAYMTAGRPAEAINTYEKVLALEPASEVAINNLAALVADHARGEMPALDRALALASRFRTSTNPLYLDTLGWLHYRKGEPAVAAAYLERAVSLAGERHDLRYHLGMALLGTGQKARAADELRLATSGRPPAFEGLDEARRALAALDAEKAASPSAQPVGPAG